MACPAGSGPGYPLLVLAACGICGPSAAIPHASPDRHPPNVPTGHDAWRIAFIIFFYPPNVPMEHDG